MAVVPAENTYTQNLLTCCRYTKLPGVSLHQYPERIASLYHPLFLLGLIWDTDVQVYLLDIIDKTEYVAFPLNSAARKL